KAGIVPRLPLPCGGGEEFAARAAQNGASHPRGDGRNARAVHADTEDTADRRTAESKGGLVEFSYDLVVNALIAGVLLGAFYAAVTVGVSISFGMLDIVNIAHPAFIILGSYTAYIASTLTGMDPILASIVMLPGFYALGALVYQVYYASFERYGQESLRGLAFFFGLLFVTEVSLVLLFGVDYRYVEAAYIGPNL